MYFLWQARKSGSIGIFYPVEITARSKDEALKALHEQGWETNHLIRFKYTDSVSIPLARERRDQ